MRSPLVFGFLFLKVTILLLTSAVHSKVHPQPNIKSQSSSQTPEFIEGVEHTTNQSNGPLIATPRLFANDGITDIKNILGSITGASLTGSNITDGTGTVVFIIIATATAIFWIIIFLIIYYAVYGKKEKEEGGSGYGYPAPAAPSYGYGRTYIPENLLTMAWNAFDMLKEKYEKIA